MSAKFMVVSLITDGKSGWWGGGRGEYRKKVGFVDASDVMLGNRHIATYDCCFEVAKCSCMRESLRGGICICTCGLGYALL